MADPSSVDRTTVERKLPFEEEHLHALNRMRALDSYYRWTFDLLRPYIGGRVLDAGCGVGNFTELVARVADRVVAIDLGSENMRVLAERFKNSAVVEIAQLDLDEGLGAFL